ncbi:MAG: HDOD domain-containing protein [Gammaproteobacteria bacterium]|nr:HDOD domain-containing protein [Gammaproteobacteria bacterium]
MTAINKKSMKAAREFITDMAEQISMPDVYREIRHLIEQQKLNITDYIDVIEKDSVLSTRLIRIANSHYFGYPGRVEDLYQALSMIGIMQLHDLMLTSLSLRTLASIPQQIFNLEAFWKYSVQCGIAARTIAQYSQIIPINPYFTLGLLHEIGHAAMFIKHPERSLQAVDKSKQQDCCVTRIEQEYLGFDYTQAGSAMMQLWHLPELYQQITAFHLQPEQADESHRQAVQIIHLAHMFCQNPVPGMHQSLFKDITETDKQLKKLPPDIEEIIIKEITANTDIVLHILWPNCMQLTSLTNTPSGKVSLHNSDHRHE